jgi:hypothetical protein
MRKSGGDILVDERQQVLRLFVEGIEVYGSLQCLAGLIKMVTRLDNELPFLGLVKLNDERRGLRQLIVAGLAVFTRPHRIIL